MQFERFRRIFHHSTYRVLLGHKERKILSSLMVKEVETCDFWRSGWGCFNAVLEDKTHDISNRSMFVKNVEQNQYNQRVWVRGARPEEEEVFQFTMAQVSSLLLSQCNSWSIHWMTSQFMFTCRAYNFKHNLHLEGVSFLCCHLYVIWNQTLASNHWLVRVSYGYVTISESWELVKPKIQVFFFLNLEYLLTFNDIEKMIVYRDLV